VYQGEWGCDDYDLACCIWWGFVGFGAGVFVFVWIAIV
jgi:hypothetical protein